MADTERAGYKDRFRKTRLKNNAADIAKHTESQGHFYSGITSRVKPRMNQRNNTGARRNDEIGNPNLKPSPLFCVTGIFRLHSSRPWRSDAFDLPISI